MKVVVAMNAMKGSLTSMEGGAAVKEGVLRVHPKAEVIVKPLADGGDGTTDALIEGLNAQKVEVRVKGPLGEPVFAYYGWLQEQRMAIMEMAQASGLTLVQKLDPLHATTYGVGEMIQDALSRGVRNFIIGIGGSATNEGGIGMLQALGWRFLTASGQDAGEGAQALAKIACVVPPPEEKREQLKQCSFRIACDVTNPLCGKMGATAIFGPQKGVTADLQASLDEAMGHYADVTAAFLGKDQREEPGTGAAGGLGFAFLNYLDAQLTPGVALILDVVGLKKALIGADFVVTGEGKLDEQTVLGKAPVGVARLAKQYGCKVIAFAGSVTRGASSCNQEGIDAFFPIVRGVTTLEEAMRPEVAYRNLTETVEQVFRLL